MSKLEISFAWSDSRLKTFRECKYKYYLQYFLAWEGWLASAPEDKRKAYMLKNLTNMPMFIGSTVHDVIEQIIKKGRATGDWGNQESAKEAVLAALRRGWKQSVDKEWENKVKGVVNLAEHYYNEKIDKEKLAGQKQKALDCIDAFYACSLFPVFRGLKPEDWLSLEEFQKFQLSGGEEVTVKIDCGFRHNGEVTLCDWKTGKINDDVIEQLVTYAMYAIKQKWTDSCQNISIVPVYLAQFATTGEKAIPRLKVTMPMIKKQAGIIISEYPLLKQAHDNRDNPEFFPKTDNDRVCTRCTFRGLCLGEKSP